MLGPDGNVFAAADAPQAGERFEDLWRHGDVQIERIVSSASPDQRAYRQAQDEWVLLLRGAATLSVADATVELEPGDYLHLPAGTPHRVLSTAPGSLWLAVHVHPPAL